LKSDIRIVALEIGHPHHHRLRIKGSGNRSHTFRQALNKKRAAIVVLLVQTFNRRPLLLVPYPLRMQQGHGMGLNVLVDNEFHARQANAVIGQETGFESDLR
jgi:hypothetical protein